MQLYMRAGKFLAIHIEICPKYGIKPFLAINTCKRETIIDIPYSRIIISGSKALKYESEHSSTKPSGPQDPSE